MQATTTRFSSWLVIFLSAAVGAAAALGLGSWNEPRWAHAVEQRLAEQSALLDRERLLIEALSGSVNDLRSPRPEWNTGRACVTLEQLRSALPAATGEAGSKDLPPSGDPKAAAAAAQAGEHAKDEAARIVESAVSAGSWTDQDATEFHSLLALMTPTQRDEAQSALFKALNERNLKRTGHSPP
jgi:hypothetical protein